MAVQNFLTAGAGADVSADITVGAGQVLTLAGATVPGTENPFWRVTVQRYMTSLSWEPVAQLTMREPLLTLYGEARLRLVRVAGADCLVDGALA